MLDPGRDASARDAVAKEAKSQIEAGGTLKHENNWGLRKLAYEIDRSNEADYRWFRFGAPTGVLEQLDHNLKIADGVLRFRIFKVDAQTPVMAPPSSAAPGPGASRERDGGGASPEAPSAPAETEPPATPVAPEAPAEPAAAESEPAAAEPPPEAAAEPEAEVPEAPAEEPEGSER